MRSIDIRRRGRTDGTELVTYRVRWTAPDGKREARSFDDLDAAVAFRLWAWGLGGKKLGEELGEELFKKNADEGGEEVARRTVTALTREQDTALRAVRRDQNKLEHIFGQGGEHDEAILRVSEVSRRAFSRYDRIGPHPIRITGRMMNGVPRISNVMTPG
jgi:hypothetical protein